MSKIDKYKIAAEMKRNDPTMTHKEAMEIAKKVEKIYFDEMGIEEAIAKAKEMLEKKVER